MRCWSGGIRARVPSGRPLPFWGLGDVGLADGGGGSRGLVFIVRGRGSDMTRRTWRLDALARHTVSFSSHS